MYLNNSQDFLLAPQDISTQLKVIRSKIQDIHIYIIIQNSTLLQAILSSQALKNLTLIYNRDLAEVSSQFFFEKVIVAYIICYS